VLVGHGDPDFPDGEGLAGEFVQDVLDGADRSFQPSHDVQVVPSSFRKVVTRLLTSVQSAGEWVRSSSATAMSSPAIQVPARSVLLLL
jgi:hypothetical protein